jgi:hypothetical protein
MSTEPSEESQLQETGSLKSSVASPSSTPVELPHSEAICSSFAETYDPIKQSTRQPIPPEEQKVLDENEE